MRRQRRLANECFEYAVSLTIDDDKAAEHDYSRAIYWNENNAKYYAHRGHVRKRLDNQSGALADYKQAYELSGDVDYLTLQMDLGFIMGAAIERSDIDESMQRIVKESFRNIHP